VTRPPGSRGRADGGRLGRRALGVCLAVALVHGTTWAFVDPPLQGPDEPAHIATVEYVAHQGRPPDLASGPTSFTGNSQVDALAQDMPISIDGDPSFSPELSAMARRDLRSPTHVGPPPLYVSTNPPLYYALAALPTLAIPARSILDRMLLMRLVSVLLFGVTVALGFVFIREVLPGEPWAWTVGGLALALQPVLAFMGGAVSPDSALFASAAGLFAALARAFRLGLTPRRGAMIGLAALLGCLSKGTMYGLLPGAALGTLLCVLRQRAAVRENDDGDPRSPARLAGPRSAARGLVAGAGLFAVPFAAWLWVNTHVFSRAATTTTSGYAVPHTSRLHYVASIASYIWQQFLPRLPFMGVQFRHDFPAPAPGLAPFPAFPQYALWQVWLEGFIGRFGFSEYSFPTWFNVIAATVLAALGICALHFAWRASRLRRGRAELITFTLMLLGNFTLVALIAYQYRHATGGINFEQTRYLFPCIVLYGLIVAAACRALGPRWGRVLGAVVVVLAAGHAVGALLLTMGRYYG